MKYKDINLFKNIKIYNEDYLYKLKAHSDNTNSSYIKTLEMFLNFLKEKKEIKYYNITVKHFNEQNIKEFLEYLERDRKNSNKTINQRLAGLKSFCKFIKRQKLLSDSDLALILDIDKRPEIFNPVTELTLEQIKIILSLPIQSKRIELRDLAFMTLLYDSGCRDSELLNLKLGDVFISEENSKINVIGKGNKFRAVPISKEATVILRKYIDKYEMKNEEGYLFYTKINGTINRMSDDNAARILAKYEQRAKDKGYNIPHLHPHVFRHARALHLYHAGMPLELVSEWLGHQHLETSLIYTHADFEMKQKAIDKFSSKNANPKYDDMIFDEEEILKKFCGFK